MDMAERTRSQRAQEGVRIARSYNPYDQYEPEDREFYRYDPFDSD